MLAIKDNIILATKKDVILSHLYIKGKELNIPLSEGVREVLFYMYDTGGIEDEKAFNEFTKLCIQNTSIKTRASVRNTLSKCVTAGIVINDGKYKKQVSSEWLPSETDDIIGISYKIINKYAI